jgi:hypothetical protein
MQIFERALLRAGYQSVFTEGFNPKPKLEFAQPLSLGIAGEAEIALAELRNFDDEQAFSGSLNRVLPVGIRVNRVRFMSPYRVGQKKHSLMSLYGGSEYRIECPQTVEKTLIRRLAGLLEQPESSALDNVRLTFSGPDHLELRVIQAPNRMGNVYKILSGIGLNDSDRSILRITRLAMSVAAESAPEHKNHMDIADARDRGVEHASYFDMEF